MKFGWFPRSNYRIRNIYLYIVLFQSTQLQSLILPFTFSSSDTVDQSRDERVTKVEETSNLQSEHSLSDSNSFSSSSPLKMNSLAEENQTFEVNGKFYNHIVFLVHGYQGTGDDLLYLKETIEKVNYNLDPCEKKEDAIVNEILKDENLETSENKEIEKCKVLVHIARSNEKKTGDGVIEGGTRLANEINEAVYSYKTTNYPNLKYISIVGNSLGGLYARYALSKIEIFDDDKEYGTNKNEKKKDLRIETTSNEMKSHSSSSQMENGLIPHTFLTTVSPHLGTRSFTYIPLPQAIFPLLSKVMGQTGSDLLLRDHLSSNVESSSNVNTEKDKKNSPLLYRMSEEEHFLKPLRAFKYRVCYGNFQGDHLVPTQSALFHPFIKRDLKNSYNKIEKEIYLNQIGTRIQSFEEQNIDIYELSSTFNDEALSCNEMSKKQMVCDRNKEEEEIQEQWERKMAENLNEKTGKWEKYITVIENSELLAHNYPVVVSRNKFLRYFHMRGAVIVDQLVKHFYK